MLLLLIVFSFYSTGSVRSVDAFDIGIPDIPFLNFNLDNNDNSNNEDDLSDNELKDISNLDSNSNTEEMKQAESSSNVEPDNPIFELKSNNGIQLYDSLPFPSNTVSNAIMDKTADGEDKDEEIYSEREFNQISSYIPNSYL